MLGLASSLASAQLQIAELQGPRCDCNADGGGSPRRTKLSYDEPADWFIPVRHMLGAELMKVGHYAQAESVYRQDLIRNPGNGWSLFGLAQALRQQGKHSDAAAIESQFAAAWKHAGCYP